MKRFFILSLLVLSNLTAFGCTYIVTHNYYLFSVCEPKSEFDRYSQYVVAEWAKYAGDSIARTVYDLPYVKPSEFETSQNPLIETARRKNDTEMLTYLRRLVQYHAITDNIRDQINGWDYPTKDDLAQRKENLLALRNAAALYKGKRLVSRYALLRMRCDFLLANHRVLRLYWENTASKLPASVFRDLMENLYAGSLLRLGLPEKATEIYARQGDLESMKWLVRKERNLAGIKKIFAQNPNSPLLPYLVQDFTNNVQETADNLPSSDEEMPYGTKAISYAEGQSFIRFAEEVVAGGKSKTPALWKTAQALLLFYYGQTSRAHAAAEAALRLDGTPRMKDNARVINFFVHLYPTRFSPAFADTLLTELQWLDRKQQTDAHYGRVLERVVYQDLMFQFSHIKKNHLATVLMGWINRGYDTGTARDYFSDYFNRLDSLSADTLIAYKHYLLSPKPTALERWLTDSMKVNPDYYDELIGTHLLHEGRFADAIPFLEKLPLSFLSQQNISAYAARRDFSVERWMHHQMVDMWYGEPTPVKTNQKLDFCRKMLQLHKAFAAAKKPLARQQAAYDLAVHYYQASYLGDCWYLTEYYRSSYDSCKAGRLDFARTALDYLQQAEKTTDLRLHEKVLYAQAFIPLWPMYVYQWYGWEIDEDTKWLPASRQFRAMQALSAFARTHPASDYVTRCDVLARFNKYRPDAVSSAAANVSSR